MNKTNFYFCCNDSVAEIQSRFSRFYPDWVINFFSNIEINQSNDSCVMFSSEVKIRDISPDCGDRCIDLNNNMSPDELEKSIHDYFGLHVEISPRTGCQANTVLQEEMRSSKKNNPERVRLPERSNTVYYKYVPYGC